MPYLQRALTRLPLYRSGRYTSYRRPTVAARRSRGAVAAYRATVPRPFRGQMLLPKQGFPERLTVNLPWQTQLRVSPGVVSSTDYILSPNNANDLDVTAGGASQARGYDQWSAQYGQVRVNYADCHIVIRQRAAHGVSAWVVFNNEATAISTSRGAEIQNALYLGATASNTQPIDRKFRYDPARALGLTHTSYQTSESTLQDIGANVARIAYMHLVMSQIDAVTVLDVEISVVLKVNMTFEGRLNIVAS